MGGAERHRERWAVRASVAGLLLVLCFLAGFSIFTQHRGAETSRRADRATRLSALYEDARHWVGEAKSEERRYRFEGSYSVRFTHDAAERRLVPGVRPGGAPAPAPGTRPTRPG